MTVSEHSECEGLMPESTTTPSAATVPSLVCEQLLQPRRAYLHHRAPRSTYVHQLRRSIASGKARPVEMLLAISMADLDDGIPLALVRQAYDTMIALLEQHAARRQADRARHAPVSLLPLIQRETRDETAVTLAEQGALAAESPATLDSLLDAIARHEADEQQLVDALRAKRAAYLSGSSFLQVCG